MCSHPTGSRVMKVLPDPGAANIVFRKPSSAQVLKANMRIVGNCEYGIVLYRNKLPKFNNDGKMVFNCFEYPRDTKTKKIHPTQKSLNVVKRLVKYHSKEGDIVLDPFMGSGTTAVASKQLGRNFIGCEIDSGYIKLANERLKDIK